MSSHLHVDSLLSAKVYNSLIIDHKATEKAELVELQQKHLPYLIQILNAHDLTDILEPHLLHRHFILQDGEALVHKTLDISGSESLPNIRVDVAKVMTCHESIIPCLVPLLWMTSSSGDLVAYEYGLQEETTPRRHAINISDTKWTSFARELSAYVHNKGIADIVALKDKNCVAGGEYVVPTMRVLFRVPTDAVHLQKGSEMLESGWKSDTAAESDTSFPECTDGHVTKTRQTTGGTVAHYHKTTEDGTDAINEKEVAPLYTNAMWNAAKSREFWALPRLVNSIA